MGKSQTNCREFIAAGLVLALTFTAGTAFATPTWIGVYGAFERYSGGDHGTFTVLMNDDYFGLYAELGIQINGGAWTVCDMSYDGQVDDNSKWVYAPGEAFPPGAKVVYYFHGHDQWGYDAYDSNDGNNYAFTVGLRLTWGELSPLPTEGSEDVQEVEIAAYNRDLYAVWQEWGIEYSAIYLAVKPAGEEWQPKMLVGTGMVYPSIAVSETGIHILYGQGWSACYIRSTDGGASWSAPIEFTGANYPARYAALRAEGEYIYLIYDDFIPPEVSRIFFRRMHKDAPAWEDPVFIFERTSYKSTVHVKDFEVRGGNLFLSTYAQGWYGGSPIPFYHESTDGGWTWREDTHAGISSQLAVDGAVDAFAASTDSGAQGFGVYFQKRRAGESWSAPNLAWFGVGSVESLAKVRAGFVLVSGQDESRYYRISEDGGATWSAPGQIDTDSYWAQQDVVDGNDIHLLVMDPNWPPAYYTISTESGTLGPACFIGALFR